MQDCLFCKIVQQHIPSHRILENENFLAFLSIFPNTEGVTVIIPKQHYSSYAFDLDNQVLTDLVLFSKQVAQYLDVFFADVGRTAMVFEGFGVDHVHAKLFPMHGTAQTVGKWQPIKSNVNKYFHFYEGYISTHDHLEANADELATLAAAIRNSIMQQQVA
jgi:histidine triad (HIT) family protein